VTSRLETRKSLTFFTVYIRFRPMFSIWFFLFLILKSRRFPYVRFEARQLHHWHYVANTLPFAYVVDTVPNKMHRIAGWVPVRCPEATRHIRHAKPNQIPERCPAGPSVDFLCRKGCGHVLSYYE
jgi:hypothetical protein